MVVHRRHLHHLQHTCFSNHNSSLNRLNYRLTIGRLWSLPPTKIEIKQKLLIKGKIVLRVHLEVYRCVQLNSIFVHISRNRFTHIFFKIRYADFHWIHSQAKFPMGLLSTMLPKRRSKKVHDSFLAIRRGKINRFFCVLIRFTVMRLGKKKEKDRDLEKEQCVDGVARLICCPNPKQSHPVPLRGIYIR